MITVGPLTEDRFAEAALVSAGFQGQSAWLYLHASDAGDPPDPPSPCTVRISERGRVREYVAGVDGAQAAMAEASVDDGTGVLWWMEVTPAWRRKGVGRVLLRTLRHDLWRQGASEMVLYVDHDNSEELSRRPALALYWAEDFRGVERPLSYQSPDAVEEQDEDPPAF